MLSVWETLQGKRSFPDALQNPHWGEAVSMLQVWEKLLSQMYINQTSDNS